MPGGALTANTQMMRDNNLLDKYPAVIKAMSEVVRRGGFGTSVTPVSQFYFQQAFNNVILGPWQRIADGYGKMVLGYFGKPPVPPDPEIVALAQEQLELPPTTDDPRHLNDANPAKGIAAATARLTEARLPVSDENIFIAASLKEKGVAFLKGEAKIGVRKNVEQSPTPRSATTNRYTVRVNKNAYDVVLDGDNAVVNGLDYTFDVAEGTTSTESVAAPAAVPQAGTEVRAQLPGTVLRLNVAEGRHGQHRGHVTRPRGPEDGDRGHLAGRRHRHASRRRSQRDGRGRRPAGGGRLVADLPSRFMRTLH